MSKAGFIRHVVEEAQKKGLPIPTPEEIKGLGRRQHKLEITDNDINNARRKMARMHGSSAVPSRSASRKHLKLLVERFGADSVADKINAHSQNPVYQLIAGLGGREKALAELKRLTEKRPADNLNDHTQELFKAFS